MVMPLRNLQLTSCRCKRGAHHTPLPSPPLYLITHPSPPHPSRAHHTLLPSLVAHHTPLPSPPLWGSSHTPPLPTPVGLITHPSPPLPCGAHHTSPLPSSAEHYSKVEIELNQEKNCTKLLFTQTEIPESEYDRTAQGWTQYYWRSIQSTFGYGAHLL